MKYYCNYCGKPVKPNRWQKVALSKGQPIYCNNNDKACYKAELLNRNRKRFRKKPPEHIKCAYRKCGKVFLNIDSRNRKYCPGGRCQYKEAKLRQKDNANYNLKSRKKKDKPKPERACQRCGEDAYPNYFFCPACHSKVSSSIDSDENVCIL